MSVAVDQDAGQAYEQLLSRDHKRSTGTVYTPAYLVSFVLDAAGYTANRPLEELRLLEPACGCGAFLLEAMSRLAARLTDTGVDLSTRRGGDEFVRLVERNLHGADIDPTACDLGTELLIEAARRHAPLATRDACPSVRCEDFLADHAPGLFDRAQRYDLVVGNPPYVTTSRISDAGKHRLRRRFRSAHGRIDLYAVFFERALELLAPDGCVAFITPDKYLASESARELRRLMTMTGKVLTVARFRSHRIFEDAATVPCVTVAQRGQSASVTTRLDCVVEESTVRVRGRHRVDIPQDGKPWHLLPPQIDRTVERIRGHHPPLSAHVSRLSAGIATGRDGVFVLPESDAVALEQELVRPALRGQDVEPGHLVQSGLRVIVPYVDGLGLVDIERYPAVRAYLSKHRRVLEQRHCVKVWSKAWYDLHDPWPAGLDRLPKVLLPDVANGNRFAFDPGHVVPLHSAYYLVPKGIDGHFLAALLNSEIMEFMVRLHAPVVKDGYSRYRKQFLQTLPVPAVAPEARSRITAAGEAGDAASLNDLVAHAFGLSGSDVRLVGTAVSRLREGQSAWMDGADGPES